MSPVACISSAEEVGLEVGHEQKVARIRELGSSLADNHRELLGDSVVGVTRGCEVAKAVGQSVPQARAKIV